jgi:hypothetical protein
VATHDSFSGYVNPGTLVFDRLVKQALVLRSARITAEAGDTSRQEKTTVLNIADFIKEAATIFCTGVALRAAAAQSILAHVAAVFVGGADARTESSPRRSPGKLTPHTFHGRFIEGNGLFNGNPLGVS